MESKFHPSSAGQAKRSLSSELQESPTAKRAKRARSHKRYRSKNENELDGYVKQQDWVSNDNGLGGAPAIRYPAPARGKQADTAHVMKPTEKNQAGPKNEPKKGAIKQEGDTKDTTKSSASPRIEANVRKTRGGMETERVPKKPFNVGNYIPAVAGPSKPTEKKPKREDRELSPLSDCVPRRDLSFKAYPNPPLEFPSSKKAELKEPKGRKEPKEAKPSGLTPIAESLTKKVANGTPSKNSTVGTPSKKTSNSTSTKNTPKDTTPTEPETSPIPASLQVAPAGTKTLKAINKHLKALSTALTNPPNTTNQPQDLTSLLTALAALQTRLEADARRAAVRHEILFCALLKIAAALTTNTEPIDNTIVEAATPRSSGKDKDSAVAAAAGEAKKEARGRQMLQARKTLEQCLRSYSEDMERAVGREGVDEYAGLVAKYAGDLFKTIG